MDFLIKCQNLFLGLVGGADDDGEDTAEGAGNKKYSMTGKSSPI